MSLRTLARRFGTWLARPWPRRTAIVLVPILAAAISHVSCQVRQLDVMFDSTEITLGGVATLKSGHGDLPALNRAFLQGIEEVRVFDSRQPDATPQVWGKGPGHGDVRPMYFEPVSELTCSRIRLQPSLTLGDARPALSLYVEGEAPCALRVRAANHSPLDLVAGSRLDLVFLHPSDPPTQERPPKITILESVRVDNLRAELHGEISGLEGPFTCKRGHTLNLAGWALESTSIGLAGSLQDPLLTVWARAKVVTDLTIDGAHCASGLYIPKGIQGLLPWGVFLSMIGFLRKYW